MTQVLIVGAGVVGLAVADELTRRGIQVELFERNSRVGSEASSAAAGILAPQGEADGPGPFLDLLLAGYQMIPEAVTRLQTLAGIDLLYKAGGMLTLALSESDEQEMDRQFSWQEKAGLRLERVGASQIKKMEPAVDGPVRGGVWWPQTAQLDNVRMVDAYARVVELQGGKIHTGTPVTRFLVEGDQAVGVETPAGKFQADWVVNCAGPWAGFDASLSFAVPTVPVRGQILQFRTSVPLIQRILKSPRAYLVQRAPGQILVGTTVEHAGFDKKITQEGRESILTGVREITSRLASLTPETAWAGLRPGTPDKRPILGPTPIKRLLVAAGHFRNGILLAPLTGRLIADWITTGNCSWDLSPFSVTRFLGKAVSAP